MSLCESTREQDRRKGSDRLDEWVGPKASKLHEGVAFPVDKPLFVIPASVADRVDTWIGQGICAARPIIRNTSDRRSAPGEFVRRDSGITSCQRFCRV